MLADVTSQNFRNKLSLSYSDHIVLATFGVRYDSHFVIDILYKKFAKLLTDPRMMHHTKTVNALMKALDIVTY